MSYTGPRNNAVGTGANSESRLLHCTIKYILWYFEIASILGFARGGGGGGELDSVTQPIFATVRSVEDTCEGHTINRKVYEEIIPKTSLPYLRQLQNDEDARKAVLVVVLKFCKRSNLHGEYPKGFSQGVPRSYGTRENPSALAQKRRHVCRAQKSIMR